MKNIKNNLEFYFMFLFLIMGGFSNELSKNLSKWIIGNIDCTFFKDDSWFNVLTQSPCTWTEIGLEWILHWPIFFILYTVCLFGFINATVIWIISLISKNISDSLIGILYDPFSPVQTFIVSAFLSILITSILPLNTVFRYFYITLNNIQ